MVMNAGTTVNVTSWQATPSRPTLLAGQVLLVPQHIYIYIYLCCIRMSGRTFGCMHVCQSVCVWNTQVAACMALHCACVFVTCI